MIKNCAMNSGILAALLLSACAIAFSATRIVVCEEAYKSQ